MIVAREMATHHFIAAAGAVLAAPLLWVSAPLAHAEVGDQSDAEQAVRAIYNQVQVRCTPGMPPQFQSISWTMFYPRSFGQGRINDAHSSLGGPFKVAYFEPRFGSAHDQDPTGAAGRSYGQWGVDLQFC